MGSFILPKDASLRSSGKYHELPSEGDRLSDESLLNSLGISLIDEKRKAWVWTSGKKKGERIPPFRFDLLWGEPGPIRGANEAGIEEARLSAWAAQKKG